MLPPKFDYDLYKSKLDYISAHKNFCNSAILKIMEQSFIEGWVLGVSTCPDCTSRLDQTLEETSSGTDV